MDSEKSNCSSCRECCKFYEEDLYFAPLFTKDELDKIKNKDDLAFKPYKSSKNVFQIGLIRSKSDKNLYVCPLLDEDTHLCRIYSRRPFDCRIWPFIFMKDQDNKRVLFACFDKDMCPVTDKMGAADFEKYKEAVVEWVRASGGLCLIKEHPSLIWDHEKDTSVIATIDP